MGTVVDFIGACFDPEGRRIRNFDTEIALYIFDDVYRTILRLFFDLFSEVLSKEPISCLSVGTVVHAETSVLGIERLDVIDGRLCDGGCV